MDIRAKLAADEKLSLSANEIDDITKLLLNQSGDDSDVELLDQSCIYKDSDSNVTYQRGSKLSRENSKIFVRYSAEMPPTVYEPVEKLGRGSFASVRRFSCHDHEIAVKKPRSMHTLCETDEKRTMILYEAIYEYHFTRKAYPNDGPYSLYHFADAADKDDPSPSKQDWRFIQPFIQGTTLLQFSEKYNDPDIVALVIFNIAVELQRIHDLGIIHGDISVRNIMVKPDFSIRFIDFDFAYDINSQATTAIVENKSQCYFAPERLTGKQCGAHPSQDLYSLAFAFNIIIHSNKHATEKLQFHCKYACILEFIAKSLNHNPNERLTLKHLIDQLNDLLLISRVKIALNNPDTPEADDALVKFMLRYQEKEAFMLLHSLCRQEKYQAAQKLVDFLQTIVPYGYNNAVLDLFILIIHFSIKLPKIHQGLYHSMARSQTINSLVSANKLVDTLLHPTATCDSQLMEEMNQLPALKEIYENLCTQKYMRAVTTPQKSPCHIM